MVAAENVSPFVIPVRWRWWKAPIDANLERYGRMSLQVKAWRQLPLPPRSLWERKLAADMLQKQVDELRK